MPGQNIAAQQEKTVKMSPRIILLLFEPSGSTSLKAADLLLLYDSLLIKLANELPDALFLELLEHKEIPALANERTVLAARMEADAWLWVGLSGSDTSLTIEMVFWDRIAGSEVFNFKLIKDSLKGLERHFWKELVEKLKTTYKKIAPQKKSDSNQLLPKSGPCRLLIKAKPQTAIDGLDQSSLITNEAGEVTIELQRYRTYVLKAQNNDYETISKAIYLTQDEQTISFNQKPKSRWAGSLYIYCLNYPGLELTYYPLPDFFFVRGSLTTFSWSLPTWIKTDFQGFPVLDFNISCGINFFRSESIFYSYLAVGSTLRIMGQREPLLPDTDVYTGFLGFSPVIGGVMRMPAQLQLYGEYCPIFFLVPSLRLNKLIYDPFCFNVGLRVHF